CARPSYGSSLSYW
nr:immunoglobulin heavy chain junction region [Mus musculus]MBK4189527.1 immunoglobulin heavy chain junction region [Mus musculus]